MVEELQLHLTRLQEQTMKQKDCRHQQWQEYRE
jgi:hypothetical protein